MHDYGHVANSCGVCEQPSVNDLNQLFAVCRLKMMCVKQIFDGVEQLTRYIVGACRKYEVVESASQGKRLAIQQAAPCKRPRCREQQGQQTKNSRLIKHRLLTVCMS